MDSVNSQNFKFGGANQSPFIIAAFSAILTGILVFILLPTGTEDYQLAFAAVGALNLLTCLAVFTNHGGGQVTVLGVYSIPHGLFVGGAAALAPTIHERIESTAVWVLVVMHVGYLVTVCATAGTVKEVFAPLTVANSPDYRMRWVIAALVSIGLRRIGVDLGIIGAAVRWCSLTCVAVSYLISWKKKLISEAQLYMVFGCCLIGYTFLVFEKNGRLQIATLGLILLSALSLGRDVRRIKVLSVLAVPIFLWWGGGLRSRQDAVSKQDSANVLDGLASAYAPLYDCIRVVRADALHDQPRFPRQYGKTLFESGTAWVPRSLWPSKPKGLGARLTEIYLPKYSAYGHSMAALGYGEWYINFGWLGLILFPVFPVWAIRQLQKWRIKMATRSTVIAPYLWVFAVSAFADFIWVGTFTAVVRNGFAAVVCVLTFRLFGAFEKSVGSSSPLVEKSPPVFDV
jgi:hypothetical protein